MFTDSQKQKLSQINIIKTALESTKSPYTLQEGLAGVIAESHLPNSITMREGNTLFFITYDPNQKDHGYFRALNADTPSNYLKNSLEFTKAVGLAGFKVLVTEFSDPSLLNIFKYISRKPPFPKMGYFVQELKNGGYRVTLNLGNPKITHEGALPSAPEKDKGVLQ